MALFSGMMDELSTKPQIDTRDALRLHEIADLMQRGQLTQQRKVGREIKKLLSKIFQELEVQFSIIHDLTDGISGTLQTNHIEKLETALDQIRLIANHPADTQSAIHKIYGIATEARR